MQMQMPQEIEVWYILPALRRELAKALVKDLDLSQKQVSGMMGITEAAVSMYLKSKRAREVVFSKAMVREIRVSAQDIYNKKSTVVGELMRLSGLHEVKMLMCTLHHRHDLSLPDNCQVCHQPLITLKK